MTYAYQRDFCSSVWNNGRTAAVTAAQGAPRHMQKRAE
jgi:hypothetical protein